MSAAEHWIQKWEVRGRWDVNRKFKHLMTADMVRVCVRARQGARAWQRAREKITRKKEKKKKKERKKATQQSYSLLVTNYGKSLRRGEQTKAKHRGNADSERLHMIPYLSQLSLQSQSFVLWLPDFIIIKLLFLSRNSSKRLNYKSTFRTGWKECWIEGAGTMLPESFEWEKHRLLAIRRNSSTPGECGESAALWGVVSARCGSCLDTCGSTVSHARECRLCKHRGTNWVTWNVAGEIVQIRLQITNMNI